MAEPEVSQQMTYFSTVGWLGLMIGSHRTLRLHSINEPGQFWQWLCQQHHKLHRHEYYYGRPM